MKGSSQNKARITFSNLQPKLNLFSFLMGCCSSWGCLFLVLCLVHSMLLISSGCLMEEWAALMDLHSLLMDEQSEVPDSWGQSHDCCSWEGITCGNVTRRILRLKLFQIYDPVPAPVKLECWNMNLEIFSSFRELQLLVFSGKNACLQNFKGLQGLSKLKYLDLSYNSYDGSIQESVGKLVSLEVINLNGNGIDTLHKTDFRYHRNLRELHLGSNRLSGSIPASLFTLPGLEYLDLSDNLFEGHISINSSWRLRKLNLGYNQLSGRLPASLFTLPGLEYLDLSHNLFEGHIPINSSQNLRGLHLGFNQLSGNLPTSLFSLPCLEYLDLSENHFQGHIPVNSSWKCASILQTIKLFGNMLSGKFDFFWLRNCTKLKEIYLSRNTDLVVQVKLDGWVPKFQLEKLMLSWCKLDKSMITEPHFLQTQHHLRFLDLSNNNLPGSMPSWLFTDEATLVYMDLSNNSLIGSLDPILQHQTNIQLVNISLNHVEGQLPADIGLIFPNLVILDVSHNSISGKIPLSLCNISRIELVDLSNNKFTGEVPSCLFRCIELTILKLSMNSLGGKVFGGASDLSNLWGIYLDNNKFEGTPPRNLSGNNVAVMDLHDNNLSGELDTSLWDLSALKAVSLANNGLTGDIHPICALTSLHMLDLSNNYFTGRTPNCSVLLRLRFLSVSGNSLSGIPGAFYITSYISALDLSENQFTGNLEWTQYLYQINVLLLSKNKFEGQISSNLCHLRQLSIIDISDNMLSGSVPPCIGGISFEYPDANLYEWPTTTGGLSIMAPDGDGMFFWYSTNYDLQGFTFTTKGNRYTYGPNFFMSMCGIDLSANILSGEIPHEIGNLSHIKSLNLSNNLFTGSIPATFANLSEIESLDLSENRLNGSIPWQLTRLSSLEVFSVAFNNLSGCLPDSGQFGSFDMDSYKGNNNLRSCTSSSGPVAPNGTVESVSDYSDPTLYVVTAVSFVLAFWATVTFVFCHSFGRRIVLKL